MTLSYSLVQGFFWMSFAAVVGFSSVYLLECGLTSSQVGLILAVSGIVAAVTQPMVAGYADQPSALSLKWMADRSGGRPCHAGGGVPCRCHWCSGGYRVYGTDGVVKTVFCL